MTTRIIAGSAGGRRLATPSGTGTRPTSDRVREALFSALEHLAGALTGLAVLDLYAGSGAVGLEAVSRGARRVTLVERDRRTAALIRDNARRLGMDGVDVVTSAVRTLLAHPPAAPYDLVFLDPPYSLPGQELADALAALTARPWLADGALVVVERSTRTGDLGWPPGIEPVRSKRYGETSLWYGRATGPATADVVAGEKH